MKTMNYYLPALKKLNQHISIYGGLLLCAMIFARYLSTGSMIAANEEAGIEVASYLEADQENLNQTANYAVYQSPFEMLKE
jgi:hypothetical protein